MTADEMFNALGYEKVEDEVGKEKILFYIKFEEETRSYIGFFYTSQRIRISKNDEDHPWLSMQELNAINKKCEELGWIK